MKLRTAAPGLLALVLISTAPVGLRAQSSPADDGPTVADRYEALSLADDREGLVRLWRAEPESAIPVIDRDLEGSLALWEEDPEVNRAEIERLLRRAVEGAYAATEATGRRRILDYVTSFAGWDDDEKVAFRAGQQAFRAGRQALRDGDADAALRLARECHELAEPLGDWWGTAMGLGLEGSALSALGDDDRAALAWARSRLIYRELGLTRSALGIEADLAALLLERGRVPRARALISDGAATADRLGLAELRDRFETLREAASRR